MHITNRMAFFNIYQYLTDMFFICGIYIVSYFVASLFTALYPLNEYIWILVVFIPVWISSMTFLGMYDKTTFQYFDRTFRNILLSTLFSGMIVATLFFFIKEKGISRIFMGLFIFLSVPFMFLQRHVFIYVYKVMNLQHSNTSCVLIVGSQETFEKFSYFFAKTSLRYRIEGYVQVCAESETCGDLTVGHLENLEEILKTHVVDEVIFALPKDYIFGAEKYILLCERMGLTIRVLANIYDLELSRIHVSMLGTFPMLTFHTVMLNPMQKCIKRTIDIVGSIIGLAITAIASIIIIPAIKLDSPGPVFFKQTRIGLYGRKFTIYKFRSMYIDAEERKKHLIHLNEHSDSCIFKIKEDPRITRVGKFLRKTSLDELPQFFNVFIGNMSLVGTRPPLAEEIERYKTSHWRRISIKPGITGNWQVNGRNSIKDFEKIVELDTQYIDNWSIWLDICILLQTLGCIFGSRSAY